MKHTFLLSEGSWIAKGNYYDELNNSITLEGKSVITHTEILWLNEGYMELQLENPIRFENRYEIVPFANDFTSWKSFNPALGILQGRFAIVDDTIISTYVSEDGQFSGVECMIKVNKSTYTSKGFAFNGTEKLSSWAVTLVKI